MQCCDISRHAFWDNYTLQLCYYSYMWAHSIYLSFHVVSHFVGVFQGWVGNGKEQWCSPHGWVTLKGHLWTRGIWYGWYRLIFIINIAVTYCQFHPNLSELSMPPVPHVGKPFQMEPTILKNTRKTSNISRTLVCNKIDHSDVVGASPVGAAPTTSSYLT